MGCAGVRVLRHGQARAAAKPRDLGIVERCASSARAAGAPGARVHGVVFQGIGEALANLDRVLEAIGCSRARRGRPSTARRSPSPRGCPRHRRLADGPRTCATGVSLASAPDVRRSLMPIGRATRSTRLRATAASGSDSQSPMFAVRHSPGSPPRPGTTPSRTSSAASRAHGQAAAPLARPYNRCRATVRTHGRGAAAAARAPRGRRVHAHVRYNGGSDVAAARAARVMAEGGGKAGAARAKDVAGAR